MSLREFSTEELVEFKGNKRGLIINIKNVAPFEQVQKSIIDRLEENIGFFFVGLKYIRLTVII